MPATSISLKSKQVRSGAWVPSPAKTSGAFRAGRARLGLAGRLQEAGAQVTIFVDREAVRLGDKGHPLLIYGDSDLDVLLSSFLDGGGFVLVCPHCARLGGVEPDELRKGFKMATPQSIAGLSMNVDTVISY